MTTYQSNAFDHSSYCKADFMCHNVLQMVLFERTFKSRANLANLRNTVFARFSMSVVCSSENCPVFQMAQLFSHSKFIVHIRSKYSRSWDKIESKNTVVFFNIFDWSTCLAIWNDSSFAVHSSWWLDSQHTCIYLSLFLHWQIEWFHTLWIWYSVPLFAFINSVVAKL